MCRSGMTEWSMKYGFRWGHNLHEVYTFSIQKQYDIINKINNRIIDYAYEEMLLWQKIKKGYGDHWATS